MGRFAAPTLEDNMTNTSTQTKTQVDLQFPNRYNVMFFNDDHTPMDFVIGVLVDIFHKDLDSATQITVQIHEQGHAIAGTYSYEIAEQKVTEALSAARKNSFPLEIKIDTI